MGRAEVGGPALRQTSFHERALTLKALGQALMAVKEEFYTLSTATGATRTDSWIDTLRAVSGTLLVLFFGAAAASCRTHAHASLTCAMSSCCSRDNTFVAAKARRTSLEGVAIYISTLRNT